MESSLPPDPYLALGVPKDATSAAIKAAHRKLVLKCHPDKVTNPDEKQAASDLFHKIQSSYEILIDEARRSRYDAEVSLAELKRERLERRSGEGTRGHYDSRSAPRSSKDSYFKDAYYPRAPEGMAPQFEERRPDYAANTTTTAAAMAAEFDEVPSRANNVRKDPEVDRSSRRSANDVKEKTKPVARDFSRERQRVHREERKQKSQKETRRDRDRKYSTYMEDESESNSDGYSSRRRTREEEPASLRHAREEYYEKADRQAKEASFDGKLDDRTRKMFSARAKAWEYINQSNSRTRSQAEPDRHPSPTRVSSHKEVPVMVRRSSTKPKSDNREDQPRRKRDYERRSPERVEEIRKPPLPKSMSSPSEIRMPYEKSRSHDDSNVPTLKTPGLKRAETFQTYTTARRTETVAPSKSGYRQTDFSDGLPTPGPTPTYEVSPTGNIPYTYRKQYADDNEYATPDGYRTSGDASNVELREPRRSNRQGPFITRRVTRSPSPMSEYREPRERPRTNTRYPSSTSQTMPPSATRTTSYVYPGSGQGVEQVDRSSRQNSGRSGASTSARETKQLFYGEINPPRQQSDPPYREVNYAKPIRLDSGKTYPYNVPAGDRPSVVPRSTSVR